MMRSKKAQESGTLQSLIVALIVITGVAYFAIGYLQGISDNYGVELNETQYTVFQQFDEVNSTLGQLTGQFVSDDGEQTEDSDIITVMLTSAYGMIKIVFDLPSIFFALINSGIVALGIPPAAANILTWMGTSVIVVMILFAAVAMIMKVRA